VFTQELIKRLAADGRVTIVPPNGQAELRCVMRDISLHNVSYTREGRVAAASVTIEADCSLVSPQSESLIWSTGRLTRSEEFPVGDNYLANENAKAAAILQICRDLSETVQNELLDSF
jgi:outer membrane lipopolysaccharide assembly protein LptE/RlpB